MSEAPRDGASDPSTRVALVTGGSSGLGRAVVLALCREGVRVHFTYLKGGESAARTAEEAAGAGGFAEADRLDVTDGPAVDRWVATIASAEGRIDVLVNGAGETAASLLPFQEEAEWSRMLRVNLDGTRHACRAVLRSMIDQRAGSIVNIASASAYGGLAGQTAYAAAKGGVVAFTRALAVEVAPFRITVNAVVPGPVESSMFEALPEDRRKSLLGRVPLARPARPEEVAHAVTYLASEAAAYVTGITLRVDGGLATGF